MAISLGGNVVLKYEEVKRECTCGHEADLCEIECSICGDALCHISTVYTNCVPVGEGEEKPFVRLNYRSCSSIEEGAG